MPGRNKKLLFDTIESLYDGADSVSGLLDGIAATCELLDCRGGVLLQLDLVGSDDVVLAEYGLGDEGACTVVRERNLDGNFLGFSRGWDQDQVYDSGRLQADEELVQSAFYACFLESRGLRHAIAGVIKRKHSTCLIFCGYRSQRKPAFSSAERESLQHLLPHWRRAIGLRHRLAESSTAWSAAHRILDFAPFAILAIDSAARIRYKNAMAETIIELADGLAEYSGRLRFTDPACRRRFTALLAVAASDQSNGNSSPPSIMPVGRTASSKPYQLMVFPLRPEGEPADQNGESYAVFIYDPSLRRPVDTVALRDLEGLTEAEARLCYSLYNTKSLSETAQQLDVSVSTAKTHLLNTFRKLGINSQAELMKYLAHMPKLSATSQH